MTRILAWDTSSKTGVLVAIEAEGDRPMRLVGEWTLNVAATHSERLLWAVHQLLEASQWKLDQVDAFAVGVGPGSFTGLRIGITTARTLAHALDKPLMGISSLALLARPAAKVALAAGGARTLVIAATDACKGELFALWGEAGHLVNALGPDGRKVTEAVVRPEEWAKTLKKKLAPRRSWMAVGEGRARYPEAWAFLPGSRELESPQTFPELPLGRVLGELAWETWRAGLAGSALEVHPRYVRAADAELKLKAGLLRPAGTRGLG